MSFYNQQEHSLFDRTLVDGWLKSMKTAGLSEVSGDTENETEFTELLDACESSFERDVLYAIRDGSFELPDEAQHTIYDGDEPVAKPDFFYDREGTPIAVFVDGPVHKKDYVKKDDEQKRTRLKRMGYRVVPIDEISQVPEVWETI
jgi:hypothetical protein